MSDEPAREHILSMHCWCKPVRDSYGADYRAPEAPDTDDAALREAGNARPVDDDAGGQ